MKHKLITLVVLVGALGCSKPALKTTAHVTVQNKTSRQVEESDVDCGLGYYGLGVLPPGVEKEYLYMPAFLGAPVQIKWKYVNDSRVFQNTNVLGRTVKPNDTIKIVILEDKAVGAN